MPHANTTDVETVLLRTLTDTETDFANLLLPVAAATLRRRIATLDDRMTLDADFGSLVRYVEASAVARILRNPDAVKYEVVGPFSSQRADVASAFGFTDEELSILGVGSGAFSIKPHLAPATLPAGTYPDWWYDFGPVSV